MSLELLVGVLLHSSLFLLFNVYLFRRYRRHRVFSSWRACAPTLWGLALVLGLDVAYWAFALTSSPVGIAHQGMTYLIVYGALNVLVFLGATGVLWGLVRQARRQQTTIAPLSLLTLHFCIYLAGLTILFPYIGELP
ncbi:MAG: hypothetical protein HYV02_00335 [Deltaproteobacteria bacterium]|nr:hypothetical protein [Deltaproteobacteria bacterium]